MSYRKILQRLLLFISILVMALNSGTVFAANGVFNEEFYSENKIEFYNPTDSLPACTDQAQAVPSGSGGSLDNFLRVLAYNESGGDPHAQAGTSSASGKYQYIDSTWQSRASMYPPSGKYARAKSAPESVQDAVAYIEYAQKFKQFHGDLFKLAVSHFYPIANTDPSLLDVVPPSNVITPRQYADRLVNRVKSQGPWSKVKLYYTSAPQFAKYAPSGVESSNATSGSNSIGSTGAGGCSNSTVGGAVSGNVVQTALNYAWPKYHPPNYLILKPAYAKAVQDAQRKGLYVGGGPHPGVDCGGFVTRVMQDSGADPKYGGGGNTSQQLAYMKSLPSKYKQIHPKSTADLQPGDIAINGGTHTYMYVGQQPGFQTQVASASYSPHNTAWRSPMAGMERPADNSYEWFRLVN